VSRPAPARRPARLNSGATVPELETPFFFLKKSFLKPFLSSLPFSYFKSFKRLTSHPRSKEGMKVSFYLLIQIV